VILMEVLAGASDDADRDWLRRLLYSQHFLPVEGPADYESAADLYRLCRRGWGGTAPARRLPDRRCRDAQRRRAVCADADFQVIARHAPLRLAAA
jgi:hypothetical protein